MPTARAAVQREERLAKPVGATIRKIRAPSAAIPAAGGMAAMSATMANAPITTQWPG